MNKKQILFTIVVVVSLWLLWLWAAFSYGNDAMKGLTILLWLSIGFCGMIVLFIVVFTSAYQWLGK